MLIPIVRYLFKITTFVFKYSYKFSFRYLKIIANILILFTKNLFYLNIRYGVPTKNNKKYKIDVASIKLHDRYILHIYTKWKVSHLNKIHIIQFYIWIWTLFSTPTCRPVKELPATSDVDLDVAVLSLTFCTRHCVLANQQRSWQILGHVVDLKSGRRVHVQNLDSWRWRRQALLNAS